MHTSTRFNKAIIAQKVWSCRMDASVLYGAPVQSSIPDNVSCRSSPPQQNQT